VKALLNIRLRLLGNETVPEVGEIYGRVVEEDVDAFDAELGAWKNAGLTKNEALPYVKALPDIKKRFKNKQNPVKELVEIEAWVRADERQAFKDEFQTWVDLVIPKADALIAVKALPDIKARLKAKDKGALQDVAGIRACVDAAEQQAFDQELDAWVNPVLMKDEAMAEVKKVKGIKGRLKAGDKGALEDVAGIRAFVDAGEQDAFDQELDAWVKA